MNNRPMIKAIKKDWILHLMLFPSVLILIIYSYIPMLGIAIAFKNYNPSIGFFNSPWIGLTNFKLLFNMPGFTNALRNTLFISTIKIIVSIVIPVTFSLLLNEVGNRSVKKYVQTIVYLPHFISWVLISGIMINILGYDGGINQILGWFGIEPIIFLGSNKWFPIIIIISHIWKEFGYDTIIYLAAITGVNTSLYEAAQVDGAGHWKQMIHVTLPAIVPTIILMTTLSLGNVLNAGFDQIFNLLDPVVYESGDIIDTLVYRLGFVNSQFGISTAAGLFKSAISCVLIVVSYKLAYKLSGYRLF